MEYYIVKNFLTTEYYTFNYNWSSNPHDAYHFRSKEEAKEIIKREDGYFQIETIYIV